MLRRNGYLSRYAALSNDIEIIRRDSDSTY